MTTDPAHTDPGAIAPEDTAFKPQPMPAAFGEPPESMIGRRLQAARTHYKLSVEALSRLTKSFDPHDGKGISPPSLARYESGTNHPGARELRLLCEALAVSADWLLYGQIATGGKTAAEQQFIDAFRRMVAEQKDDVLMAGGLTLSETLAAQSQHQRAALLQEARRPVS